MIKVGRPIQEVTINGLEWLVTKSGKIKKFKSKEKAKEFMIKKLKSSLHPIILNRALENSFVFKEI